MAIATTAETSESTTAWSASAPNSVAFDVPVAFSTAKSRTRSSAVRYTIRAMIPAATIQSSTWMKSIDCLPLCVGRWRSALTWSFVSTLNPSRCSRGTPFVITALASGCPANDRFCASFERHEDRVDAEVVPKVADLSDDTLGRAADHDDAADVLVELVVDEDLAAPLRRSTLRDLRCADAARHVAEQVHVGERGRPDRRSRRDHRRRRPDAGSALHGIDVVVDHELGGGEGARRPSRHHPGVGVERVHEVVDLGVEPVAHARHDQGHGEDDRRGERRDQEPSPAELQITDPHQPHRWRCLVRAHRALQVITTRLLGLGAVPAPRVDEPVRSCPCVGAS